MSHAPPTERKAASWEIAALGLVLILNVWWRAHTFAPTIVRSFPELRSLWPHATGETEPLDCDEAAYGYIGRRLARGGVLYRDVSENKPPLGYWIYQAAVAIGGPTELTIRLLPIPFVSATMVLVWWSTRRVAGRWPAFLAAAIACLWSTDPYLYANGAQFEVLLNAFAIAAFAGWIQGRATQRLRWFALAGGFVGAAVLVRQVALAHWIWLLPAIVIGADRKARALAAAGLGFAAPVIAAMAVLISQGALASAFDDVVRGGAALATDVPPEAHAPSVLIRWLVGNADPQGGMPPPFGRTAYLVWWGGGCWPFLIALIAAIGVVLYRRERGALVLVAAMASIWIQIVAPNLYWAHYYAMLIPFGAVSIGVGCAGPSGEAGGSRSSGVWLRIVARVVAIAALLGVAGIQTRDYFGVPPEEITRRFKGGGQWVVLREIGRELERRTREWDSPRLFVWGYQSPLLFYSGLDSPAADFFANDLLKTHISGDHRFANERFARIESSLESARPEIIFVGYPPFASLQHRLDSMYERSSISVFGRPLPNLAGSLGLWVRRDHAAAFRSSAAAR